jgi:hypothetical protein
MFSRRDILRAPAGLGLGLGLGIGCGSSGGSVAPVASGVTTDGGVQLVTDGGTSIVFDTLINPSIIMTGNSVMNGQGGSLGVNVWLPQDSRVTYKDYNPNPSDANETTTVLGPRVNDADRVGGEMQLCNGLAQRLPASGTVHCVKHGKNGSVLTDFLSGGGQNAKFSGLLADVAAVGKTTHVLIIHHGENEASGAGDASMLAHMITFVALARAALPGTVYVIVDYLHPIIIAPGAVCAAHGAAINADLAAYVAQDPLSVGVDLSVPFPDGPAHDPSGASLHPSQDQYMNRTTQSFGKEYFTRAASWFRLG